MRWVTRPLEVADIDEWERSTTTPMRPHRFSASWSDTKAKLEHEADQLGASEIIVQIDVAERDIRLDGGLRANARPSSDLVIVNLDTRHGPMRYPSGRFYAQWSGDLPGWQANVRAVALTLESLRAVDRYGVSQHGEQYRGWQALPAGDGPTSKETAALLLASYSPLIEPADLLDGDDDAIGHAYRDAAKATHPDHGGGEGEFETVQAALEVLRS